MSTAGPPGRGASGGLYKLVSRRAAEDDERTAKGIRGPADQVRQLEPLAVEMSRARVAPDPAVESLYPARLRGRHPEAGRVALIDCENNLQAEGSITAAARESARCTNSW